MKLLQSTRMDELRNAQGVIERLQDKKMKIEAKVYIASDEEVRQFFLHISTLNSTMPKKDSTIQHKGERISLRLEIFTEVIIYT